MGVSSCNTTMLFLLFHLFEPSAHGRIVNSQMCGYLLKSVSVLFVGLDYCSFPTLGKDPLQRWLDRFELDSRDLLKLLIPRGVPLNEGFAP